MALAALALCAGLVALVEASPLKTSPVPPAVSAGPKSMTFELFQAQGCPQACPLHIVAEGEITRDSVAAFLALWNHLKRGDAAVLLASGGGDLDGAMALGRAFHRLGVAVTVGRPATTPPASILAAECDSACVYAFAGGARRSLAPGSSLGVHRFYMARAPGRDRKPQDRYTEADFARMQRAMSELAAYLAEMGVGPRLLAMAADVPPTTIRKLAADEVQALNLVSGEKQQHPAPRPIAMPSPAVAAREPARAPVASIAAGPWPLVERNGRPWLILTVPTVSRRFGEIDNEVAIGCPRDSKAFVAAFREILPVGRPIGQSRAAIASPVGGEFVPANDVTGSLRGAISRDQVDAAERAGALALEVTSNATGGYPARVAFPASGLGASVSALEKACGLP